MFLGTGASTGSDASGNTLYPVDVQISSSAQLDQQTTFSFKAAQIARIIVAVNASNGIVDCYSELTADVIAQKSVKILVAPIIPFQKMWYGLWPLYPARRDVGWHSEKVHNRA